MPGYDLDAYCPCGFTGHAKVGFSCANELLVPAYDPENKELISIDIGEARTRNLTIYDVKNPPSFTERTGKNDIPKNAVTYLCPVCGKKTLRFFRGYMMWD